MHEQAISSKNTTRNILNKIYTKKHFDKNSIILDYGGGAYNKNLEFMKNKFNAKFLIYDKYNKSKAHNDFVLNYCKKHPIDYIVCSNVLNIIKEEEIIIEILNEFVKIANPFTTIYISIYEGNRNNIGTSTKYGWQRNETVLLYERFFPKELYIVDCKNGIYELGLLPFI